MNEMNENMIELNVLFNMDMNRIRNIRNILLNELNDNIRIINTGRTIIDIDESAESIDLDLQRAIELSTREN